MKVASVVSLVLQICLFVALTIALFWVLSGVKEGGLDERFAFTQIMLILAFLAPYLALPISIALTIFLRWKGKYRSAIWIPLAVIGLVGLIGQIYLRVVPDPIMENFGPRAAPYPGFLVLPPEAVPEGFKEEKHSYTKRQYIIDFAKIVDGQKFHFSITEGDRIGFSYTGSELVQEFEHEGITGQIYTYLRKETGKTSISLSWLNPPKQRISIDMGPKGDYSPDDLIKILKSMKPADDKVPPHLH